MFVHLTEGDYLFLWREDNPFSFCRVVNVDWADNEYEVQPVDLRKSIQQWEPIKFKDNTISGPFSEAQREVYRSDVTLTAGSFEDAVRIIQGSDVYTSLPSQDLST